MGKKYKLTLQAEGLPAAELKGEFSDHEHAVLTDYLAQFEALLDSKPLREGMPCQFEVRAENGALHVSSQLPTSDDLGLLLYRLRPLILESESASFMKVAAIVGKHSTSPHVRLLIKKYRKLYDGRAMQEQIGIRLNSVLLNSEKMWREWLNSYEYHRDPDTRRAIEQLLQGMPDDLLRAVFVCLVVEKVKAIQGLASLVALMLGRASELTFTIERPG